MFQFFTVTQDGRRQTFPLQIPHRIAAHTFCALAVFSVQAICIQQVKGEPALRPNVIVILADDMGYGDVACNNPQSKIKTPHLDSLAREGIRFTDAHSGGSSCIPSRYSLMTGRFAVRHSMSLANGPLIEPQRMTLPSMLRQRGYKTAMVGKWHLGFDPFLQNKQAPADYSKPLKGGPVDRGFDSFFGMHASLDLPPYFYIRGDKPVEPPTADIQARSSVGGPQGWNHIQGEFYRAGKISPSLKLETVTPRFFREAVNIIQQHNKAKPLFLYLALPSPHTPWLPLEQFRGKSGAGMYGDFVMQVDAGVGRVVKTLEDAAISDNTLVMFSSDNGPVWYDKDIEKFNHRATGPLRGMKFSAWEGGHRMPFLVRWPAGGGRGVCGQTVAFADVMKTCAALTGAAELPAGMAEDSVSFLPYIRDPSKPPVPRPPVIHDRRTIRDGDWKLILPKNKKKAKSPGGELYQLSKDLGEQNNLFKTHPDIAQRLRKQLEAFNRQ